MELLLFDRHDAAEPFQTIVLDHEHNRSFAIWHAYLSGLQRTGLLRVAGLRSARRRGPAARAPLRPPEGADRPVQPAAWTARCGSGDRRACPATTSRHPCDRRSSTWPTTTGRVTRRCAGRWRISSSTRCTSAVSPGRRPRRSRIPAPSPAWSRRSRTCSELGVTAVELLPVFEFDDSEVRYVDGHKLTNYWGYSTSAFFAPHAGYCVTPESGRQVREFRDMVKALHAAGIEVILDVVFNHTDEGNHLGPLYSFAGHRQRELLLPGPGGPAVLLRLLRLRQHADGQPPDRHQDDRGLPGVLGTRDARRRVPVRRGGGAGPRHGRRSARTSRPWCGRSSCPTRSPKPRSSPRRGTPPALYQVGTYPGYRWAEWNGRYRDDMRQFVQGRAGTGRRGGRRGSPAAPTCTSPRGHGRRTASTSSPATMDSP